MEAVGVDEHFLFVAGDSVEELLGKLVLSDLVFEAVEETDGHFEAS